MAKLIHGASLLSTKSELDLYNLPPTQVAIERGFWHEARLVNSCTNGGPYNFHLQSGPQYIQLNKSYIWMQLKVTKPDGSNLTHDVAAGGADDVGPINLLGKTFFKQVKLYIAGKQIYDSGELYAYRAYFETELNYGEDAKKTHLQAAMYYLDGPTDHVDDGANEGLTKRKTSVMNSAWIYLMAPIHSDLFMSPRLIPSKTDIRLELTRNSDTFCLLSYAANPPAYKIVVNDVRWYVRLVELSPSIDIALESALITHAAKYPVRRIQMTTLYIPQGRYDSPVTPLFQGQIPRRVVLGLLDPEAFYGSYAKSPFVFKNYNMKQIFIKAGGHNFPQIPLEMDFDLNYYTRPYVQLMESLGMAEGDKSNGITMEMFKTHICLFAFDLTPDEDDGNHWELLKEGATTVHLKLGTAAPRGGLQLLAYGEFDNLLTIDRNRDVQMDYTL